MAKYKILYIPEGEFIALGKSKGCKQVWNSKFKVYIDLIDGINTHNAAVFSGEIIESGTVAEGKEVTYSNFLIVKVENNKKQKKETLYERGNLGS